LNSFDIGQQLYNEALKQLEIIEKKYTNQTSKSTKDSKSSFTDIYIQKIIKAWQSTTGTSSVAPVLNDKELEGLKKSEFEAITLLLQKAAREYQNNDALLLLAELNFVSVIRSKSMQTNFN
jgi:SEL1 protein